MLTSEEKKLSISKAQKDKKDTGSSLVQVSILTDKIEKLNNHLKDNSKDKHSRRGLLGLVNKRRRHLNYLKRKDKGGYEKILETLGLRK